MSLCLEVCLLPAITKGQLVSNSRTLFKAGESVTINFTCNTNYFPENPTTTCQSDRTWDPRPQCSDITCAVPVLTNGYYKSNEDVVANGTQVNYQSTITPFCLDGFTLTSSIQRTCQDNSTIGCKPTPGLTSMSCLEDRTWGPLSLQCTKVLCNDTRDVEHNVIQIYPQLAFGDIGEASYNSTFFNLISGSLQMSCSSRGRLSWIAPPEFG